MDCAEEVHGALVIARGDGPELLELDEEVLDQMPRLVEVLVVEAGLLAVALGWDHGRLAGPLERLEHTLIGVERLVRDQGVGRETRQQGIGTFQVVRLPGREGEAGRVAQRVDGRMDLRAQPATAASDRFVVGTVFLTAPALC
jgi:hypothetical protein